MTCGVTLCGIFHEFALLCVVFVSCLCRVGVLLSCLCRACVVLVCLCRVCRVLCRVCVVLRVCVVFVRVFVSWRLSVCEGMPPVYSVVKKLRMY